MTQLVSGQRTIHFHTHRADDVVTILHLREAFGLDVVLHHVSEAWRVADQIAAAGVSCSLIVIDSPGGKEEAMEIRSENGAILESLGVPVAFHTDDPITDSRLFLRSAGLAVRAGMTPEGALRALTLSGAEMMGLDAQLGSLDVGKDADLVVLSGDPLSVWTKVEQTWVSGQQVFDRSRPEDAALATGGDEVMP
jgi:imidazolonepropionase-like amidohydrolase